MTYLFRAMSEYLQGTICRETPPLYGVEELAVSALRLPADYVHPMGLKMGGRYALTDDKGKLVWIDTTYRNLVEHML